MGTYYFGNRITFTCNSGYMLDLSVSGSGTSALCLNTGSWSHNSPGCGKDIINFDILNAAPKFLLITINYFK